jgi:hypothetical protein
MIDAQDGKIKSDRLPREADQLHLIIDNFSPHKHPDVRSWTADNDIELVFLPTYASWLNWIESEFAALRYFALNLGYSALGAGIDRLHAEGAPGLRGSGC